MPRVDVTVDLEDVLNATNEGDLVKAINSSDIDMGALLDEIGKDVVMEHFNLKENDE